MADEAEPIGQQEMDALLRQASEGAAPVPSASAVPTSAEFAAPSALPMSAAEMETLTKASTGKGAKGSAPSASRPVQSDIEFLLNQAEQALASVTDPNSDMPAGVAPFQLRDFASSPASADAATIELVSEVQLDLQIELGRTHMYLEDVLKLRKGSVVPLDKLAGDPVDIYVNGRMIARGEVLVLNDNFCVRVAELVVGETQ